jgi:hypothetical protein
MFLVKKYLDIIIFLVEKNVNYVGVNSIQSG